MDIEQHKTSLLGSLYSEFSSKKFCKKNCSVCPLLENKKIIFGEGNANAKLLLIGEAPGRDEHIQGRPFVGRSGKLLEKTLSLIGIERKEVFITNVVKYRPTNNKLPHPEPSSPCQKLLLDNQLKIICPKAICALGAVATQALLSSQIKISQLRGRIFKYSSANVIPTFHPAYILRNPARLSSFVNDIKLAHRSICSF